MPRKYKIIDLFAGTGGFSLGLEQTNRFKTVFANDFEASSKNIYDLNFKNELTLGDIHDIDPTELPDCDIITAGFPCQPFSLAGKKEGFNDARSNVFWKLIEIIKEKMPQVIILENVKNLVTHDNGNTFKTIKRSIKKLGYHIKYKVLNTADLTGIPHNRERIYIVGFIDEVQCKSFSFPHEMVEYGELVDYLETDVDFKVAPKSKYVYNSTAKIYPELKKSVVKSIKKNVVYQYRRYYVRENKSSLCPTLTANMGTGGHNVPIVLDRKLIRKLTPRECFNLQGFPEDFELPELADSKLYKLAGNAISVPVVKLIGDEVLKVFEKVNHPKIQVQK